MKLSRINWSLRQTRRYDLIWLDQEVDTSRTQEGVMV